MATPPWGAPRNSALCGFWWFFFFYLVSKDNNSVIVLKRLLLLGGAPCLSTLRGFIDLLWVFQAQSRRHCIAVTPPWKSPCPSALRGLYSFFFECSRQSCGVMAPQQLLLIVGTPCPSARRSLYWFFECSRHSCVIMAPWQLLLGGAPCPSTLGDVYWFIVRLSRNSRGDSFSLEESRAPQW